MSTRAPQRCVKCSELSGNVVLRRGHRCPFQMGSGLAVTLPVVLPPVPATAVPSISVADVHEFDIGDIGNFDVVELMPSIPEELFDFSNPDLDGPLDSRSNASLDSVSWLTEPPLGPVNPPLEFTSENIFRYLQTFNTDTGNIAGGPNTDINVNSALGPGSITTLSDSVFHLALDSSDNSMMAFDGLAESLFDADTIPVPDEQPELNAMPCPTTPATKKVRRANLALLSKISKTHRKVNKTHSFVQDAKKRTKRYSKITNKINDLASRLYEETHCYGAVMFASMDSISIGHTKSYFTPNLTSSEGARIVLKGCSQELGDLMTQQWHLSQVDHTLQVDRWRNDAVEGTTNQ